MASARNPAVFVDVDDTLVRTVGPKRIPIPATVRLVRALREQGAVLYLWSRGGPDYAREVAEELGLAESFDGFLPKPELLLDDASFERWGTVALHPAECASLSAEGVLALVKR
jgi:hypothetical protein